MDNILFLLKKEWILLCLSTSKLEKTRGQIQKSTKMWAHPKFVTDKIGNALRMLTLYRDSCNRGAGIHSYCMCGTTVDEC